MSRGVVLYNQEDNRALGNLQKMKFSMGMGLPPDLPNHVTAGTDKVDAKISQGQKLAAMFSEGIN